MSDRNAIPLCHCNLPLTPTPCATCGLWDGPTEQCGDVHDNPPRPFQKLRRDFRCDREAKHEGPHQRLYDYGVTQWEHEEPTTGANTEPEPDPELLEALRMSMGLPKKQPDADPHAECRRMMDDLKMAGDTLTAQNAECRAEIAHTLTSLKAWREVARDQAEEIARLNEHIAAWRRHQPACTGCEVCDEP